MASSPTPFHFQYVPGEIIGPSHPSFRFSRIFQQVIPVAIDDLQIIVDEQLNAGFKDIRGFKVEAPLLLVTYINSSCRKETCTTDDWKKKICTVEGCPFVELPSGYASEWGRIKPNLIFFSVLLSNGSGECFGYTPFSLTDNGMMEAYLREILGVNSSLVDISFDNSARVVATRLGYTRVNFSGISETTSTNNTRVVALKRHLQGSLFFPYMDNSEVPATTRFDMKNKISTSILEEAGALGFTIARNLCKEFSRLALFELEFVSLKQFRGKNQGKLASFKGWVGYHMKMPSSIHATLISEYNSVNARTNSIPASYIFPLASTAGLDENPPAISSSFFQSDIQFSGGRIFESILI